MAISLLRACAPALIALCARQVCCEAQVPELPLDDACAVDDAGCALSLRQLRGELSSRELPSEASEASENADADSFLLVPKSDAEEADASEEADADSFLLVPNADDEEEADASKEADADSFLYVPNADVEEPDADSFLFVPHVDGDAAAEEVTPTTAEAQAEAQVPTRGNATEEAASMGGACLGQNGWDTDFANRAYHCAFTTMANAYRSGKCMASRQGVSSECGQCMGQLIHCGTKCMRQCCYGRCYQSQRCVDCGNLHCSQGFIDCAGVAPPPGR